MFRQACAIESAALRSGLEVLVVLTAKKLLLDDNTTCQLYMSRHKNIHFYTLNITSLAHNTPLQGFFQEAAYKASPNSVVHLSDALRVLLVWRFGGLYLDTDYVVLNDLSEYQNITVKTGAGGMAITNNAFSFSAGHPFLWLVMKHMEESYRPGCWTCIGPELLTKSLRQYSNQSQVRDLSLVPMARSDSSLLSALSNINISEFSQSTGRGLIRSSTLQCPSASRNGEKYS